MTNKLIPVDCRPLSRELLLQFRACVEEMQLMFSFDKKVNRRDSIVCYDERVEYAVVVVYLLLHNLSGLLFPTGYNTEC